MSSLILQIYSVTWALEPAASRLPLDPPKEKVNISCDAPPLSKDIWVTFRDGERLNLEHTELYTNRHTYWYKKEKQKTKKACHTAH